MVIREDGTHLRTLVGGPDVRTFAWSPDGRKVAYLRARPMSPYPDLYVIGVDGRNDRRILRHARGDAFGAETIGSLSWPRADQIGFASNRVSLAQDDLFVVRPDGTGLRNLTRGRFFDPRSPAWSLNGATVVFEDHDGHIIVALDSASGKSRRVFGPTRRYVPTLVWSPDGRRIVLHEYDATNRQVERSDITVIDAAGGNRHVLSRDAADSYPVPAPDGRTIAYVHDAEVRLVRPDGTGMRTLPRIRINYNTDASGPYLSWSPDGRKLAYLTGSSNVQTRIAVADAGGTGKPTVITTPGWRSDTAPTWQPSPRS